MAAVLPHRQGILRNPSPSTSPFHIPPSLPTTPALATPDAYFPSPSSSPALHPAALPPLHKSRSPSTSAASRKIRFAPFPDPRREVLVTEEGMELALPPVFIDEADESQLQRQQPHILTVRDGLVASVEVSTLDSCNGSSHNPTSSLLFSNTPNGIALVEASSIHKSDPALHIKSPPPPPIAESDKESDFDMLSPSMDAAALSSSASSLPPSSPEDFSPAVTSSPKAEKRSSWATRKLLRPLFGRNNSKDTLEAESSEDSGTLGLGLSLSRSESRGSTRKAKKSASKEDQPLQSFQRAAEPQRPAKRPSTAPSAIGGQPSNSLYPPLHQIPTPRPANPNPNSKPRTLFSSPTATSLSLFSRSSSSSSKSNFGRTQSLTSSDLKRVQSGGSVKSTKSLNSALNAKKPPQQAHGVRRGQLKMLNGRVYGARRLDPFANVRDEEPEFVEWGFGGMGSVNNHLHSSEGNIWAKVQSSAGMSIGSLDSESWASSRSGSVTGSGESMRSNGHGRMRTMVEDDDDGTGMAWVKKRREAREKKAKEEREREMAAAAKVAENEEGSHLTPTSTVFPLNNNHNNNPTSSSTTTSATATPTISPHATAHSQSPTTTPDVEHVTTAVTVPFTRTHSTGGHHPHMHHRTVSSSTIQASSLASLPSQGPIHVLRNAPERRGSADTAKGVPVSPTTHSVHPVVEAPAQVEVEVEELGEELPATPRSDGSGSGSGGEDDEEGEGEGSEDDVDEEVRPSLSRTSFVVSDTTGGVCLCIFVLVVVFCRKRND
ncbi:hypothetical protein BXZ70DRAFT_175178 [Cristinia sonorae]|uniref:Uncharacterized protein n=1 Tax=Cristinia sonorae TaxID=1940300 RepID=A0A8K0UQ01_9AGAR|nr:hypothetical protein BXZ70DRAFT_175178 [Cristinia sonorae]